MAKTLGIQGTVTVIGQCTQRDAEPTNDGTMYVVALSWIGESFKIFANELVYQEVQLGGTYEIEMQLEVDHKKAASNKFKPKRGGIIVKELKPPAAVGAGA